jgi:hypothetical protein
LGALESAARISFYHRHGYSYDQALAFLPHEGLVFRVNPRHHIWRGRQHRLPILRSPESFTQPAEGQRVWILGGSTSEPQPTETDWPGVLRRHLRNVDVINMAHSGYGTSQMQWLYRSYHSHIRPAAIILFSGWNSRGAASSPYGWRPPNAHSAFDGPAQWLSAHLIGRSALYGRLWHSVDAARATSCHAPVLPSAEVAAWAAEEEAFVREVSRTYRTFLVLMPGLAMRDDARDALPKSLDCLAEAWPAERARYEEAVAVIRTIGERLGVAFLDAAAAYRALPVCVHVSYFRDPAHQTNEGDSFLGNAIARALKSDNWGATLAWEAGSTR